MPATRSNDWRKWFDPYETRRDKGEEMPRELVSQIKLDQIPEYWDHGPIPLDEEEKSGFVNKDRPYWLQSDCELRSILSSVA